MKRFSQRCNRKRVANRYEVIPFSWALLTIAVLHFSIWSIGVTEQPARFFFAREIANCKQGGAVITAGGSTTVIYSSSALLNAFRSLQKELRSLAHRLISERISSKAPPTDRKKKRPGEVLNTFPFIFQASNEESQADESAAAPIFSSTATLC